MFTAASIVLNRELYKTKLNCCRKYCKYGMGLRDVTSRRRVALWGPRALGHGTERAPPAPRAVCASRARAAPHYG